MVSNYHISPAIPYSNEAINQFHFLVMCAHYIFYNFPQVIFYYIPKRFFSYCIFALQIDCIFPMCVCVLSKIKISHSNIIPIYYCGEAQDKRGGSNHLWVYIYLGWTQTWLKLAQMARHGYDAIFAHNLFGVYHIDKLSADNRTSFYNGKMCECIRIFHVKMWWMSEYSYEKCEWCWLWC